MFPGKLGKKPGSFFRPKKEGIGIVTIPQEVLSFSLGSDHQVSERMGFGKWMSIGLRHRVKILAGSNVSRKGKISSKKKSAGRPQHLTFKGGRGGE